MAALIGVIWWVVRTLSARLHELQITAVTRAEHEADIRMLREKIDSEIIELSNRNERQLDRMESRISAIFDVVVNGRG